MGKEDAKPCFAELAEEKIHRHENLKPLEKGTQRHQAGHGKGRKVIGRNGVIIQGRQVFDEHRAQGEGGEKHCAQCPFSPFRLLRQTDAQHHQGEKALGKRKDQGGKGALKQIFPFFLQGQKGPEVALGQGDQHRQQHKGHHNGQQHFSGPSQSGTAGSGHEKEGAAHHQGQHRPGRGPQGGFRQEEHKNPGSDSGQIPSRQAVEHGK